jgi:hypothetical protein
LGADLYLHGRPAAGLLVAALGFLIQLFPYAVTRTPESGLVRVKM